MNSDFMHFIFFLDIFSTSVLFMKHFYLISVMMYACQFLSSDDCICQVSVNLDYKNVARAELIKFSSGFP
jgi:hypothetical protein